MSEDEKVGHGFLLVFAVLFGIAAGAVWGSAPQDDNEYAMALGVALLVLGLLVAIVTYLHILHRSGDRP